MKLNSYPVFLITNVFAPIKKRNHHRSDAGVTAKNTSSIVRDFLLQFRPGTRKEIHL